MKKVVLAMCAMFLLLSGCTNNEKSEKGGKEVTITIDEAFKKMDDKETFLLLITRPKCTHCIALHEMLDKEIKYQDVTIYNVVIDDSTDDAYYADKDKLEKRIEKAGVTPHIYRIEKGVIKDDKLGYDEENPQEFWDWVNNK